MKFIGIIVMMHLVNSWARDTKTNNPDSQHCLPLKFDHELDQRN